MVEWKEIKELFDFEKGTLQSSKCVPGQYTFITAAEDWKTHESFTHDCEALIFAMGASGSLGRTHYVNGKFISSDLCFILTPKNGIKLDMLFYHRLFNFLRVDIVKKTATGTSKLAINKTNYGAYKLPFFDYEHQLIFRDKIEKINEISQNFDLSIDDQLVLFKKLRQQILQEAIEGKLTAEWRKNNPELTGGNNHASKLLEQIKGEKEQLVKDKKIKKQKPLAPITDDEKPFVVPDGWGWSRIGQVGTVNRGKSPIYDKCGKKLIINQKCVRWFNVDAQHCKTISSNWFQALPKELQTDVNDVLVNSTGEGTIGRSAVVDEKSAGLIFDSHVLRIKLHIEPKYAAFLINSNFGQNQINDLKGAKSTKQTELGVNNLTNFVCPLPPLFEQKVIVERVDKLMHMIDMLEVQGTERKEQSKMLMQAVLQEAFEVEV